MPPARLLIADDHVLVREGMRTMLAREPSLEVIGEAENGRVALEICRRLCPDLVLMDVRMPRVNGLKATQTIKEELPKTKVLIVSAYEDPLFISEAVRVGADGYVLKLSPLSELLDAIRRVLRGESSYP